MTGGLTFESAMITFFTLPLFGLPSGVVYFRPKFLALRRKYPSLTLFQIIMQTMSTVPLEGHNKDENHADDILDDTESATEQQ